MSNLSGSGQSSSIHPTNDEHEETNGNSLSTTSNKSFSTSNCRITSPLLIKRQQTLETKIANNQAYDEIHDVQPKHSSMKKNDRRSTTDNAHELMQSNYYDPNRFDLQVSSTRKCSERGIIDINVEDYKKTIAGNSTSKTRPRSPPFGETIESIQEGVAQSAGILLETKKKTRKTKTHEQAVIDYFPKDENDDDEQKDRTRSSSSSSSSDNSSSDQYPNIPYKTLLNKDDEDDDDDDDDDDQQQEKDETVIQRAAANESTTLLNKTSSQTYGTQTTSRTTTTTVERSKCLATNGYNSQGSSINTKSSSDNSGSIRTNSGSDNDEESDEEPYNNSTLENNVSSMSVHSRLNDSTRKTPMNKNNDQQEPNRNATTNDDEHHLQVPRFKQPPIDDSNENLNKKSPSNLGYQQSMINASKQSSSQQQRTPTERPNVNSTRSSTNRTSKKRKQLQQQELIRTEFIPGHRGDLDVDELVMFIDGNSKGNHSLNEPNGSNKSTTRKKSRKTTKTLSATDDQQEETKELVETNENLSQPVEINGTISNLEGSSSRRDWYEQTREEFLNNDEDDDIESFSSTTKLTNQLNSVTVAEPFVTVKNRRRSMKERRAETNNNSNPMPPTRFPTNNDKRRFVPTNENETKRLPSRSSLPNMKASVPSASNVTNTVVTTLNPTTTITTTTVTATTAVMPAAPPLPPAPVTTTNPPIDSSIEKPQSSPRLSSHSSTSSLSSLLKRTSKAPAVVFLNKSANVELNDVSFGFDIDPIPSDSSTNGTRRESEDVNHSRTSSLNDSEQRENFLPDETSTERQTISTSITSPTSAPQRNTRDPQFYSGSDIRPHHRHYHPTQTIPTAPFIDPLLLLQYNQQRFPTYPPHLAYMNILRTPYLPAQTQYVLLPSTYPTVIPNETETDGKTTDETSTTTTTKTRTTSETNPEALPTYPTVSNESTTMFYPPTVSMKGSVPPAPPLPTIYPHPSALFYPRLTRNPPTIYPPPAAYFQPISSPSLFVETKLDEHAIEQDNHSFENSRQTYHSKDQLPSTSSDIMSNALQLVYSQQRRNAQTDRFNLDDLTAYLALKWTETVDHYEQGDKRIIIVDQHD